MRRLHSFIAIAAVVIAPLSLVAQQPAANVSNANAALPFGATSADPVSKWTPPASAGRQLTLNDLLTWKGIRSQALSNDGKWFAYIIAPNEGDAEVVVRATSAGGRELRFPIGDPSGGPAAAAGRGPTVGGTSPSISGNNKWVAFLEYASANTAGRGGRGGRGGGATAAGGAGGAAPAAAPKLAIVDLATGAKRDFESVRSFRFAGEKSDWVAILHSAPATTGATEAAARIRGHDARTRESCRRNASSNRRCIRVCIRRFRRLGRVRGDRCG